MNLSAASLLLNRTPCRLVLCIGLGFTPVLCFGDFDYFRDNFKVPPTGAYGKSWSTDPFDFQTVPPAISSRYQQVYRASAFSSISQRGGWLVGLFWFSELASLDGYWGGLLPSTELSLSVTPLEPDHLSTNFAENLGTDVTVVFRRGPLYLNSSGSGAPVDVKFQIPFFYDPAAGNLLLEIKNYEPTCCFGFPLLNVGALDAYRDDGDEISRVFGYDVNSATGLSDTLGLTTYFVTAPRLAVSIQSTNIVVRWPRDLDQFRLQETRVLGSSPAWEPAEIISYTVDRGIIIATLPLDPKSGMKFFRMIMQSSAPNPEP